MAQTSRSHESRIAGLEAGYENLQREIHGLRTDLRNFAQEVRTEVSVRGRTQWSPLIASVAVVVAIVGGLASGPMGQLDRLEQRVHRIETTRFTAEDGALLRESIARVGERVDEASACAFTQPDAERMSEDIRQELRWLRDRLLGSAETAR